MKRPLLLFALSVLMVLAGCSKQVQQPPTPPIDEILLGANLEMSGKYAQSGELAAAAIEMALQEKNAAGGIHGRQLRLVVADNHSSGAGSEAAFTELADNKQLLAVIGPSRSSTAIPVGPFADKFQLPFIATIATNPRVTVDDLGKTRPYAFRACFIDPFQGSVLAHFALRNLQASTAALLVDKSSDYSTGLAAFFRQNFSRQGGRIVYEDGYNAGDVDFHARLQALLSAEPDVLFIPGFEIEAAHIVAQARALGFQGPIVGGDGWEPATMVALIGSAALNNTYYCSDTSPADTAPAMQDFVMRFKRFTDGKEPQQGTVLAYEATVIALHALETSVTLDRQQLRAALEKTQNLPGITGTITLDDKHNARKSAVIIELIDGHETFKTRVTP